MGERQVTPWARHRPLPDGNTSAVAGSEGQPQHMKRGSAVQRMRQVAVVNVLLVMRLTVAGTGQVAREEGRYKATEDLDVRLLSAGFKVMLRDF